MAIFQHMHIALEDIPQEIINEYNLLVIAYNIYVYVEIRKGMYDLREVGIIAYIRLVDNMVPHGYSPACYTPGLWKHDTLPTTFTLAVDDFGVKFFKKEHAEHLFNVLQQN